MEKDLFHFFLNLLITPIWMPVAKRGGFELSGGPIQGKRGPQFLLARHPAQDDKIFGFQRASHVLEIWFEVACRKRES